MVMLWVMLLVALWLKSGSVVSVCIPNAFINTLDVLYPAENNLVHNPYYTKLSAEIVVDAAEFTKKQQEFHICAIATMDVGNERVEIYKECGRSVFGQGAVYGKDGVNYLQLSLHHNNTKLCEVNITVHCCADVVSAGAVLEAKKQATLDSFLRTGSDFKRRNQEKETESHTSKNVSIGDRFVFSERSPLNVVIGIKSSAMYNAKRESIRSSWFKQAQLASQNPINIVPFFLIGNSTNAHKNETIASLLQHEQQLYRDMLLANDLPVSDSYLTLGQKVLYFMKWVFTHSHGARIDYVIMCDDDVYIDVWLLNEFLSALQHSQTGEYFYGGEVPLLWFLTPYFCISHVCYGRLQNQCCCVFTSHETCTSRCWNIACTKYTTPSGTYSTATTSVVSTTLSPCFLLLHWAISIFLEVHCGSIWRSMQTRYGQQGHWRTCLLLCG